MIDQQLANLIVPYFERAFVRHSCNFFETFFWDFYDLLSKESLNDPFKFHKKWKSSINLIPLQLFQIQHHSTPCVAIDLQNVSWLFHKEYLKHFSPALTSRRHETVAHAWWNNMKLKYTENWMKRCLIALCQRDLIETYITAQWVPMTLRRFSFCLQWWKWNKTSRTLQFYWCRKSQNSSHNRTTARQFKHIRYMINPFLMHTWIAKNLLIQFDHFQIISEEFHDFTEISFAERSRPFYVNKQIKA